MDQQLVSRLEHDLERAIGEVILKMRSKDLPLLASQLTIHLMAKGAVTVYEAAVENSRTAH